MLRFTSFLWVALALFTSGCTTSSGVTFRHPAWSRGDVSLGRLAVLPPRLPRSIAQTSRSEILERFDTIVRSLPATEIVDGQDLLYNMDYASGEPLSDYQLAVGAREAEIDSVIQLNIVRYGGRYSWLLPIPVWRSQTELIFSLRLIDARSGKLLVESLRRHSKGGYWAIMTSEQTHQCFSDEVSEVLKHRRRRDKPVAKTQRAKDAGRS